MRKIFWYNPENDIALGFGSSNFTPPGAAMALARYGAPLMCALAGNNDVVVVEALRSSAYADALCMWAKDNPLCEGVEFVADGYGRDWHNFEFSPWGWSSYAARHLKKLGFPVHRDMEDMRLHRLLSHRRTSIHVNKGLADRMDFSVFNHPEPVAAVEACSVCEVQAAVDMFSGDAYLKTPWSSSGRGVWRVCRADLPGQRLRIEGCLQHQGSVLVEPAYDKVLDFAMLFECRNSVISPIGYSVFTTGRDTNYSGNILADDEKLLRIIQKDLPEGLIAAIQNSMIEVLSSLFSDYFSCGLCYNGYIGVDMMKVMYHGHYAVVPCVEVNVRTTMGVVAHALYGKLSRLGLANMPLSMKVRSKKGMSFDTSHLFDLIPDNPCFEVSVTIEEQAAP